MRIKWDAILTTLLVGCALVTTGLIVHREFFASATSTAQAPSQKPVFIKDWRSAAAEGVALGAANAPVQLIEFADFECPFCGSFHERLKTVLGRYPTQVSLTFVHFPLPMHRFAIPAARVAECAGEQGRFEPMYDRLFEQQDQLGLKSWNEFASEAGVGDLTAFDACIKKNDPVPRVEAGRELGKKLDIQGTPTLIINGWKLGHPPSVDELDKMVKAVLAGKSPV